MNSEMVSPLTHDFEPTHSEMGRPMSAGIFSTALSQIVKILCQFGSILILSRLLAPTDFGVIAMVGPVYGFVLLFHDLGLGQATIHKPKLLHAEVNTFFWINLGVGVVLSLCLMGLSPAVGWYYHDARVVPLTQAMAALVFISALGAQHGAIMQRKMLFNKAAALDIASTLLALTVSIVGALLLKNYWALYWGMAAGTVIPVVFSWVIVRWRPGVPALAEETRRMLKFGAGITSSNFTSFFSRNLDNILIGHRWGDYQLGLYDRAYKLLLFPLQRIVYPISTVIIPILSRLENNAEEYRHIFLETFAQMMLALCPAIIWTIIYGDTLITLLLGKEWAASVSIFEFLAIAALLQILGGLCGSVLISQGRTGDYARLSFVNSLTCIGGFIIGLPFGAVGVAAAYALTECFRTPYCWWYVCRKGPVRFGHVWQVFTPLLAGGAVSFILLYFLKHGVMIAPLLQLCVGLVLAYLSVIMVMSFFPQGRIILASTVVLVKRYIPRLK